MWPATGRVKAYWVSVSTFILTTPYEIASRMSSSPEPDPPWNTRSNGFSLPYLAPTASWISFSTAGRSRTWPGLYTPCTLPNVAARMYRPRSPSPSASAVASASSGVLYSFSFISPVTPSSSPPTTPISISMMMCAAAHFSSSSLAICRFSSSGTAEPSHMCDWNSGSPARHPLGRDLDQRAHVPVQFVLWAVVGVQRDVDRVLGRHDLGEMRERHGPGDHVLDRLAGQVLGAPGGDLDDPVAAGLGEPPESCVQRLAGRHVDRRVGETVLLGVVEHLRVCLWRRDRHDGVSLSVGTPPVSRLAAGKQRSPGASARPESAGGFPRRLYWRNRRIGGGIGGGTRR